MVTLKEYLNSDRIDYFPFGSKGYSMDWLLRTEQYWIRRYIRALRKEEFYMNYKRNKILQYYFSRKKNLLGIRLGFFINAGCFDIGLKIYHYGNHYFNTVPDFFTAKNQVAELPEFSLLNTVGWDITVNPMDAMGYNSGLANLLQESDAYWSPQASEILRRHIIEIDMKESKRILGFKVGQAMTPPADVQTPDVLDIEFETGSGAWESAAFSRSVTVGTGKGETTIIYLDKSHSVKTAQKIRVTVADKFHKKGYNASYAYVDFYTVVLSSFMVIEGN